MTNNLTKLLNRNTTFLGPTVNKEGDHFYLLKIYPLFMLSKKHASSITKGKDSYKKLKYAKVNILNAVLELVLN